MTMKTTIAFWMLLALLPSNLFGQPRHMFLYSGKELTDDVSAATSVEYWGTAEELVGTEGSEYDLRNMPKLEVLALFKHEVTQAELEYIAQVDQLKCLEFGHPGDSVRVTGDASVLSQLKSLEEITICFHDITDETLSFLKSLHGLKYIDITFGDVNSNDGVYHLTNEFGTTLAAIKSLEGIFIHPHGDFDDRFCQELATLPKLEWFQVGSMKFTDESLRHLSTSPTLKGISSESLLFTDAGVAHLRKLKQLERLSLDSPKITRDAFPYIAEMRGLKDLMLPVKEMKAEDFRFLAGLESLEEFGVWKAKFGDEAFAPLAGHQHIRELILGSSTLTMKSLS
ncbi:MAG: hypothetical protein KDA69_01885, partial [Planctomycetaceae bacterium]|nr:hypothetical protein [Planctomycetaceae bacterium]